MCLMPGRPSSWTASRASSASPVARRSPTRTGSSSAALRRSRRPPLLRGLVLVMRGGRGGGGPPRGGGCGLQLAALCQRCGWRGVVGSRGGWRPGVIAGRAALLEAAVRCKSCNRTKARVDRLIAGRCQHLSKDRRRGACSSVAAVVLQQMMGFWPCLDQQCIASCVRVCRTPAEEWSALSSDERSSFLAASHELAGGELCAR